MSTELERQVQWLTDRALISELLHAFARALDTRDFQAYVDNYADGASIELPDPRRPGNIIVLHKANMLELLPKSLGRYAATHHISANHQITHRRRQRDVALVPPGCARQRRADGSLDGRRLVRLRLHAHCQRLEVPARAPDFGVVDGCAW